MTIKRFIHGVLLVMGLSVIGLLFYYATWMLTDENFREMWQYGWPWTSGMVLVDYVACCLLTTVVTLYYWRSRERAEKERDKFRLQALENQLSPHFVFNNFSILAELIEVNPKKASSYLMNLSKVYRYTLSHLDHNTVTLQEELDFLHRYLQLLNERFGDAIRVNIAPDVAQIQGNVPPAVLQMLVENAIKHNEHTQTHPLIIDITTSKGHLSIRNNKRVIAKSDSAHVGNHNIVERYRLLTRRKVNIANDPDYYTVTIPLIN